MNTEIGMCGMPKNCTAYFTFYAFSHIEYAVLYWLNYNFTII